ncbi:DP-EP family protein [Pseudoalteromonas sp. ZZD1]|uniref:DP-EP family protein n=1 Tax=Pseudoalteromonas sp. ZZD1 TaxID=3139395 RepID=UPI003BAB6067
MLPTLTPFIFNVDIAINENDEAIITYYENGKVVNGGGSVVDANSIGLYIIKDHPSNEGITFVDVEFSEVEGAEERCAKEDFAGALIKGGKAICIFDSNLNTGLTCMRFVVERGGKTYKSPDPQVENDREPN